MIAVGSGAAPTPCADVMPPIPSPSDPASLPCLTCTPAHCRSATPAIVTTCIEATAARRGPRRRHGRPCPRYPASRVWICSGRTPIPITRAGIVRSAGNHSSIFSGSGGFGVAPASTREITLFWIVRCPA